MEQHGRIHIGCSLLYNSANYWSSAVCLRCAEFITQPVCGLKEMLVAVDTSYNVRASTRRRIAVLAAGVATAASLSSALNNGGASNAVKLGLLVVFSGDR